MKKVLFATTALVATAGFAAAEVNVSGYAEMGVFGGSHLATADEAAADPTLTEGVDSVDTVTQFHTDWDVTFSMTGETDNGLSFGASIDLDEGGNQSAVKDDADDGGATVFISSGPMTLTMGDTDGAMDKAITDVGIGSAIRDDHTSHAGYVGGNYADGEHDGQIARLDYALSNVTLSLSVEHDDGGNHDPVWGIGAAFSTELAGLDLGLGIGHQSGEDAAGEDVSSTAISVSTTFDSGLKAILNYAVGEEDGDDYNHMAIGLGYSMNQLTVSANYGAWDWDDSGDASGWGLAVNYDFGGGMVAQLGYGSSDVDGVDDVSTWSAGLAMSF